MVRALSLFVPPLVQCGADEFRDDDVFDVKPRQRLNLFNIRGVRMGTVQP